MRFIDQVNVFHIWNRSKLSTYEDQSGEDVVRHLAKMEGEGREGQFWNR